MDTSEPAKKPSAIVTRVQGVIRWALATKPARAFLLYQEHHGAMLADSVTYRALFSVFAGVFLGFAVAGLWLAGNDDAMAALVSALDSAIPGLVGDGGLIDPDDLVQPLAFGLTGAIALVGLIGTAIGAIASLRTAIRSLADKPADTTFFVWVMLRDLALALGFGIALAAAAVVTFFSTTALGVVFGWIGVGTADPVASIGTRIVSILVIFAIDTVVVAVMVRLLSGLKPSARSLWTGALLGGAGLTVLQVLSSLFVGGASSNPLLASFGSIIALLIWFNFSSQVILIAAAYVITGVDEEHDRVAARFGSPTPAVRRVRRAERRAADAARELTEAREAEAKERGA
ncbi:YihY/virulence factor BrkB family protein [Agromyces atrinae]|uniref:Membrane protein n=1 Tax=Agromyces atrinae TaxID=592376 RepID=A0A4Q2M7H1_9MICO|nr:YihY/virulence factor BrkB family protein [Agromyces atrinae]NYD65903.1 membrane protein [Agromyces atrinae]RXZ86243.1 YihY/virulence factor BrkB family protein [Agromyces atrinae]